jgi:antitoxin (DNA-binding transcriptional repressor) of toxin-antitoxin stability system
MRVTITKLRQDLFRLVERALAGEPLEFVHKGVRFRVVPDSKPAKLASLTRQTVVAPQSELEKAARELFWEMEAEWDKDWSEL